MTLVDPSTKKRNPWLFIAATLAVVLIGAGVAVWLLWPEPTATAPVAAAPTTSPPSARATSNGGTRAAATQACAAIKAASGEGIDPTAARTIGITATGAYDDGVRLYGQQLVAAADLANNAVGTSDEVAKRLDLLSAEIELRTACIKGGYEPR